MVLTMSEPTQPDGQPPAQPPRFDERSTGQEHTGDAVSGDPTPERGMRPTDPDTVQRPVGDTPPADATVVFSPGAAGEPGAQPPAPQPPGQYPPAQPPGSYPPGQYPPTQQQPSAAGAPPPGPYPPGASRPGGPPGTGYGGPPPGPGGGPNYGGPGGPDDTPKKKSGLLVAGLIALVVALVGALGFVALQAGDDDVAEPETTDEEEEEPEEDEEPEPTVETTEPVVTPPPTEATTTTDPVVADGSVDSLFVHVESFSEVIAEGDLDATLQRIGLAEGNNPVSAADSVLNLCAALPVDTPVSATVTWTLDNETLSEGAERVFATPADGNCINNSGEPLASGAYEVSFSDSAGAMSGVALFTVGAATVNQEFVNDTDTDLCAVELAPTAAGFYQSFEVNGGEPLIPGDSILIDIAEIEHEIRGVDCADSPLESFFASPSADPISLASGAAIPPTTAEPPPPPQITDGELGDVNGEIGSLDVAVPNGSDDEDIVIDLLLDPESNLRIATEEQSLALCAAWDVAGPLEGEMVWEFNRAVIARFPVSTSGGRIGRCIPPGGAAFDEGAYQVYLERGDVLSEVETFTVGRAQTQLGFRNDTDVAICRVGFSPNLTNWYTFYEFADSSDFEESVEPGDAFTIVAPFIENDIRAFDCDGNQVSEALDIPPTDQTLNLSDGTP